jgi:uncharacterized phiE125 gp8 family phage protein
MASSLVVVTPPTIEPITLDQAKEDRRVDTSDDDATILSKLREARRQLENRYQRAILTQTLRLSLDCFPGNSYWAGIYTGWMSGRGVIELRPPVQSVTSVTYLDPSGASQTMASSDYLLDADSQPGRLVPTLNKVWPATAQLPGAVKVTFVSGATSADLVPDEIKAAVKLLLGDRYEHREQTIVGEVGGVDELPNGVEALMAAYDPRLVA